MTVGHARLVWGDGWALARPGGQRRHRAGWWRWPRNAEKAILRLEALLFISWDAFGYELPETRFLDG